MPRQSERLPREHRVAIGYIRADDLERVVREGGSAPQEAKYGNRRIREGNGELSSGGVVYHREIPHGKSIQLALQLYSERDPVKHPWCESHGPILLGEIPEEQL